jgi:hypothetical protein
MTNKRTHLIQSIQEAVKTDKYACYVCVYWICLMSHNKFKYETTQDPQLNTKGTEHQRYHS